VKITGTRSYAAPREQVWAVLNDPAEMAGLMPGVESFEIVDDTHWKAKVKVPLGLGSMKMSIDFEKAESRPPEHARLQAKGKGVGAIMSMETQFDLSEEDGDGTAMRWEADVRILGQVASMGKRVVQPIVNQQVESVLTALDQRVAAKAAAEPGGSSSSP
jgi:carbon monoxide dehydrogenase subunit G